MAYNTGNPIGSTDPRDLSDNSENFDRFANGTAPAYEDRFGVSRKSFAGMEQDFDDFLLSSGYEFLGDYAAGIEVTAYNQIIRESGEFWRAAAGTTLPYTTTGAGMPEGGAFVSVGDAALRQELNGSPSSGQGAALVKGATIYVGSVAELEALSLEAGVNVYLTQEGRAGAGVIKAGLHQSDPYKGRFIDIANGNYWDRIIDDGVVYLSWFGPDTTGATEQEALIQSAVNLTPDHYKLTQKGLSGTVLVDIPSGQTTPRPRAVYIDHPMTLEGTPALTTKVKDFCSAWLSYTGTMSVYQAESSDVTIDGVFVDANADNHYETDVSGNKYWETGPELKRPPNGINVYCPDGVSNLKNVVIENCDVYRPLAGVGCLGSLGSDSVIPLNDSSFLNGTLETNLVVGPIIRNNTIHRARGNDCLFSSGIIDGEVYGNKSYNSMYHQVRFYTSTINCHAWDNHAYVDYDYLASGYNATDLWYWRTDNAADGQYLIRRSGFRIGAGFTSTIDCSMTNNVIRYQDANPLSAIIDVDSVDAFSIQTNVSAVKNVQMKNNRSYNSPFGGIFGIALATATDGKETEGVVFSGNQIFGCFRRQVLLQGNNFTAHDNYFEDCSSASLTGGIVRLRGNKIRYYKNSHKFNAAGGNSANSVFEILSVSADGETDMFVSDNVVEGYTGTYYTQSDAAVLVHGTDVGIKPAPQNGWAAQGGDIVVYINCAGQVSLSGTLNGSAATADTALQLPTWYAAKENNVGNAAGIQMADIGDGIALGETFPFRMTTNGALVVNRKGTNASRAGFMMSYQGDGRLFS